MTFVNCRSCPTSRMRSAHTCSMGAQRRRTAPFFFATAHRSSRSRPRTTSPQSCAEPFDAPALPTGQGAGASTYFAIPWRLAAVQTFFRYVAGREPALAATCSPVLAIPGERDYVLLSILYDTGARIQELLDLSPRDFHLDSPPFVCVRGKGRRERLCPLLPQSARLVRQFLSAEGRQLNEQQPFLQNGRGGRLGRHGARYILVKYLRRAARSMPALSRVGISPHTMRHTKAMHLLQSGVPLVMVKDFLGHADMKSTEVYVQADLDMKRKALDSSNGPQTTQAPTPRLSSSLIEWLEAL